MLKIHRVLSCFFFLMIGLLNADIMFETVTKTDGMLGLGVSQINSRSFFKSDRSRIETSAQDPAAGSISLIIITRLDLKVIWILNPDLKTYTETRIEDFRAGDQVPADSLDVVPELTVEKTGKKKKILDQECEEVLATMKIPAGDGSISLDQVIWLASDIPGYQELFEYGLKVRELGLSSGLLTNNVQDDHLREFQEKVSNIYGFPMEWSLDMVMGGGEVNFNMKTNYVVTSYACAPINNNVFDLPPGYELQK
jgi:hypothetical protein